jgi:hypothetical protein
MKPESIKCRAKRLDNGEVVEGYYYVAWCSGASRHNLKEPCELAYEIDPATLQLCSEAELKIKPKEIMDYWNAVTKAEGIKGKVLSMSSQMKTHLRARCKEPLFVDNWKRVIDHARKDPFWSGKQANYNGMTLQRLLNNDEKYVNILQSANDRPLQKQEQAVAQRETSQDRLKREMKG